MKLPLFPALLLPLPLCVQAISFDEWRLLHFTAAELANAAIAGAASDPDVDGRSNYLFLERHNQKNHTRMLLARRELML